MLEAQTMPETPIDEEFGLFSGPSPYRAVTPWQPVGALGATLTILAASLLPVAVVVVVISRIKGISAEDIGLALIATPIQQVLMVAFALFAASRYGARAVEVMALRPPAQGWRAYAVSFVLFIAGIVVMNAVINWVAPGANKDDLKMFEEMFKSPGWFVAVMMVGVGAPLSEELVFRGFLFPALAKSRLGMIGATLVTSSFWSLIHFYSLIGMIQVFVIGLMFSWMLVRTGSLKVTIFCHGLYNTGLAVAMMAGLGGWL